MPSSSQVQDALTTRLQAFLSSLDSESADFGPEARILFDSAADALQGGKRLRARFCATGWRAVARFADRSADESTAVWDLCAALEIFQAAALVHDDLIDNSDTRRGRPAAHRALEKRHRELRWSGDTEHFGRASAILLGDLLVAWSDDLLEQALTDHPRAPAVRAEYARMRRGVTTGQFLDIAEESAWRVSPDAEHADRALRVARLKSARYSSEQPLLLGALLAGADAAQQQALRGFGLPIGMAFQLRDDVLGVFGEQSVTGKPAGDDLREGKRTVLIALTRERLDVSARRLLDELLGEADLDAAQVSALQSTIIQSGALARVEEMISAYAQEADRALSGARLDNASVSELRDLARAATVRTA